MPTVRINSDTDPVLAIVVGDVHLSLKKPIARRSELDWLAAQLRPWKEIKQLSKEYGNCPILHTGDLFDRWNPPLQLVNWALGVLPDMIAIPGNHDLPAHRLTGENRSAFGTLWRSGKITNLALTESWVEQTGKGILNLYGVPFGGEVVPPNDSVKGLNILMIHEYVWIDGKGYTGADVKNRLHNFMSRHPNVWEYDIVLVGDNHQHFSTYEVSQLGEVLIYNTGCLVRRKSNEAAYSPTVGLIHKSGLITDYVLDTSNDLLNVLVEEGDGYPFGFHKERMSEFVEELINLSVRDMSFKDALLSAVGTMGVAGSVIDLLKKSLSE